MEKFLNYIFGSSDINTAILVIIAIFVILLTIIPAIFISKYILKKAKKHIIKFSGILLNGGIAVPEKDMNQGVEFYKIIEHIKPVNIKEGIL